MPASRPPRHRLELVPAAEGPVIAVGPHRVSVFFRILTPHLAEAGRMRIDLSRVGDPHGDFLVVDPGGDERWSGRWGLSRGRVVIEQVTVFAEVPHIGVSKELLRKVPVSLVAEAVASMVNGAARGVLDEYGAASELVRASFLSGDASRAPRKHRRGGPGRKPTDDLDRRRQAIDVIQLCHERDVPSLYEALADRWSKTERYELQPESARSRVGVLVEEEWLTRLDRGAFSLGPRFRRPTADDGTTGPTAEGER